MVATQKVGAESQEYQLFSSFVLRVTDAVSVGQAPSGIKSVSAEDRNREI
jgi:hypothetical protein